MKKLFYMLVVLFIMYLGIQIAFTSLSKGDHDYYEINKNGLNFKVDERSDFKGKNHNYYYNVRVEESNFKFQIYHNFGKRLQVLKDIEYYRSDKYKCILPIFEGDLNLIDIMCMDNYGMINYYHNLNGNDSNLDNFVDRLDKYKGEQYISDYKFSKIENINVYEENLLKDHFITVSNYKGIYNISDNFNSVVYKISLFKKDVYNQKLSFSNDKYYLVADYNEQYEFNKFILIDLVELNTYTITSNTAISFDSYIQGSVDGMIYLYDKDNKIQYEINVDKKTIVQYSNTDIKYYKDGTWTTMAIQEANDETMFTDYKLDYEDNQYVRIDKVGTDSGYYYLYKKNGEIYDVYRINIQDKGGLTYLFNTSTIDAISYVDDYVYFVNKNKVQVFGNSVGVRTLVQYDELGFNKNIKFNVYSK